MDGPNDQVNHKLSSLAQILANKRTQNDDHLFGLHQKNRNEKIIGKDYFKKDAEGGQYNRINNFNNFSVRDGIRPQNGGIGSRGGFRGGFRGGYGRGRGGRGMRGGRGGYGGYGVRL